MNFRFNTLSIIIRASRPVLIIYTGLALVVNFFYAMSAVQLNNLVFSLTLIFLVGSLAFIILLFIYAWTQSCNIDQHEIRFSNLFKTYAIKKEELFDIMIAFDDDYHEYTPNFPFDEYQPATAIYIVFRKNDCLMYKGVSTFNSASQDFIGVEYRPALEPYILPFHEALQTKRNKNKKEFAQTI